MKKLLLILSSKLISEEMQMVYGEIPPVLMNYKNSTILEGIYKKNKEYFDIAVTGCEKSELIEDLIANKNLNIKLEVLDESKDISGSILAANTEGYEEVTLLFGDTIVKNWDLSSYKKDSIAYALVEESSKWATFENNKELEIFDKKDREYKEAYKAFIGIFSFTNFSQFKEDLQQTKDLYKALSLYNNENKIGYILEENWVDLGHIEEYNKNKEVESRFFNEIIIDKEKGILTKKSQEKEKFQNEIKWYLKMPKELEYLTPRIFDYDLSYENLFVKMEYYSYMTLLNVFVYGNYSLQRWNKIFDMLLSINNEFRKYNLKLSKEEINKSLNEMYVNKTLQRFDKLKEDEWFKDQFDSKIVINDKAYFSINEVIDVLPGLVEKYLLNIDEFSIIHGDYFFANILYDGTSNFVRLIDARGDFGGYGIYGDPRYDLAKLSHSVNGNYDLIVSDEFNLKYDDKSINYKINNNDKHKQIKELFLEKLKDQREEIILIESLLFLSMIPLHSDYPDRQKVMYAKGMELISGFLKYKENKNEN